jgi:hypothetical protein
MHLTKRFKRVAVPAVGLGLVMSGFAAHQSASANPDRNELSSAKFRKDVKPAEIMEHLQRLQTIADANGRTRASAPPVT